MEKLDTIYEFETKNFRVEVNALPEYDCINFDDWDEGCKKETIKSLDSGDLVCFCVNARLIDKQTGAELASDYLGQCIHKDYDAFKDHLGIKKQPNCGSYFSDMVKTVLSEGRKAYNAQKDRVQLTH